MLNAPSIHSVLYAIVAASGLAPFGNSVAQGEVAELARDARPVAVPTRPPSPDIREGMSLAEALDLIGRPPDRSEDIGAACGMLDVSRWAAEGIRIISTDGIIMSITKQTR